MGSTRRAGIGAFRRPADRKRAVQRGILSRLGRRLGFESLENRLVLSSVTTPTITAIASDTGLSATDRLTNDTTLEITGTADVGNTVTVFRGGTNIGTATANSSGAWTLGNTATTLDPGTYTFTAQAADGGGGTSALSANFQVTVDTASPTVNVNTLVSKNNKPVLTGTVSDPTPSSGIASVTVVVGGQTLTATVNGTQWDAALPTALADGTYNVQATATDFAGNSSVDTTTNELVVDTVAPGVTSISRTDSNPTNATTVHFEVTFSEPVTDVDTGDFNVPGSLGASVSQFHDTGDHKTYTITVNTANAESVQLNLVDNDTIKDAAGNPLGGPGTGTGTGSGNSNGPSYTIDRTSPTVSSILRADPDPTAANTVRFTVNFSESVTAVDKDDFTLVAASAISGAAISDVSGSGQTYTVTVTTGAGDGTLQLNLTDNGTILDQAGNQLGGTGTGNGDFSGPAYTVDRGVPTVTKIEKAGSDPTNASSVTFTVTFSEAVTGVDATDFSIAPTGLVSPTITGVSGSGSTYTVTAGTGTGNGSLQLNLTDDDTIKDASLTPLGGTGTGNANFVGPSYTVDRFAPAVSSINKADTDPTSASTVHFTVTFSEAVTGVDESDFTVIVSGLTGTSFGPVTGSGQNWTVAVNTGSGSGTLQLKLVDDDSIKDTAGNTLNGASSGTFLGPSYTVQRDFPTVSSITKADADPTTASTLHFTVTFSESVTGVDASDFTLATSGTAGTIGTVTGSGTTYTVTATGVSGSGTLGLNLVDNDTIVDASSNALGGAGAGNGSLTGPTYTLTTTADTTAPTVSSIAKADADPTTATTVNFTVTFSESVTGVDAADFALATSGTAGTIGSVSGSGSSYTVAVSGITGVGTLGLNLVDNDTINDTSSNANALGGTGSGNGNFTGPSYTIQSSQPSTSTASLSGRVYVDANNDGLYTLASGGNHAGLGGVTIRLRRSDVSGQPELVRVTKTDGSYTFDNLAAGTYQLSEDQPSKFIDGIDSLGTGPTTVGTAGNDSFSGIALSVGQSGVNYNFGERGVSATYYSVAMGLASSPTGSLSANQYSDNLVVGPADTIGLYDPDASLFYLRNTNTMGMVDTIVAFGSPGAGWLPIAGDWDGDGIDTIGLYDPTASTFYLRSSNTSGSATVTFSFGTAGGGLKPIVGDWDHDGVETVGLYDPQTSTFFLRNSNSTGAADLTFAYGTASGGLLPVAGDWNGDGKDTVGVFNASTGLFALTNTNKTGVASIAFTLPGVATGGAAAAGDWNGDGTATVGVYTSSSSYFHLAKSNGAQAESLSVGYGTPADNWLPVAGRWIDQAGYQSLIAAEGAVTPTTRADTIDAAQLQPVVQAAIARWEAAGLPQRVIEAMQRTNVRVTDLPGAQLGAAGANEILIDRDAAGHGWFVDSTPDRDEEFAALGSGRLRAVSPLAVDSLDLETVVMHELGHVAGLDDLVSSGGLMNEALPSGLRKTPGADAAAAVFAAIDRL